MKKRFFIYAVLMIAFVFCLYCDVGFAAMRNLLDDFRSAISRRDLKAAQTAINEGINASDGVKSLLLYNPSDKDDDFFVPLVKALAKKGSFKDVSLYVGSGTSGLERGGNYRLGMVISSNKVIDALLEGGADPDRPRRLRDRSTGTEFDSHTTLLFETLEQLREQSVIREDDKLLERVKILAKHDASLKNVGFVGGIFVSIMGIGGEPSPTEAINFFLKGRGLDKVGNLTDENLSSILVVMKVLHDAGAGTGEANDYLKKLREQYRNIPDALKYLDKIEESFKSSSWWSW